MTDTIYLRSFYGKSYHYPSANFSNIGQLKQEIGKELHLEPEKILFYFNGKKLQNQNSIPKTTISNFITFNEINSSSPMVKPPVKLIHENENVPIIEPNGKPFNFNEQVEYIVNLQFSPDHAKAALKYTNYNLNDAVTMLVTGVPVEKLTNTTQHPKVPKTVKTETKTKPPPTPTSATPTKQPPPPKTPEVKETKNMRDLTKSFTKEQNAALRRLYEKFPDKTMVIQVFDACDRDEEKTLELLKKMH